MGKQYTKAEKLQFVETLRLKNGHIGKACKAFGINRATYYAWMELKWFASEVNAMREEEKDDEGFFQLPLLGTFLSYHTRWMGDIRQ